MLKINIKDEKEKENITTLFQDPSGEKISFWKSEEIFHEGDSYFSKMIEDFSEAKKSIYLETYIFELDDFGNFFLEALKKAAARGVKIHVLVDGIGSPVWAESHLQKLIDHKIEVRVYHPLPWISFHLKLKSRETFLRRFLLYFGRLNRRNHRKVCIIDEKIAWIGSFNISVDHLAVYKGKNAWRDTGVRVEGEGIIELVSAFQKTWARSWGLQSKSPIKGFFRFTLKEGRKSKLLRLNDSYFLRRQFNKAVLSELRSANRYIRIVNPYFIPPRKLIHTLLSSVQAGIEVSILIPQKSDVRIVRWVMLVFAERLIKKGVKVFEYLPTILHAKILMTDQQATIGSTNLNHRSFIHDLEVDIILLKPSSLLQLEAQFFTDLSNSQELKLNHFQGFRFWQKILGKMFSFLRYWM